MHREPQHLSPLVLLASFTHAEPEPEALRDEAARASGVSVCSSMRGRWPRSGAGHFEQAHHLRVLALLRQRLPHQRPS